MVTECGLYFLPLWKDPILFSIFRLQLTVCNRNQGKQNFRWDLTTVTIYIVTIFLNFRFDNPSHLQEYLQMVIILYLGYIYFLKIPW